MANGERRRDAQPGPINVRICGGLVLMMAALGNYRCRKLLSSQFSTIRTAVQIDKGRWVNLVNLWFRELPPEN
jgi:hypothetical protein